MSATSSDRVYVAVVTADADGRLREVEILPDPAIAGDQVLVWKDATNTVQWMTPAALGFANGSLTRDVPISESAGRTILTGSGSTIVSNVPAGI